MLPFWPLFDFIRNLHLGLKFTVDPTYFVLQILHFIKYIQLVDLQFKWCLMENVSFVTTLEKVLVGLR